MAQKIFTLLVPLLSVALIAYVITRFLVSITVWEWEKGLKYHKGKFLTILGPGRYLTYTPHTSILRVDMRPRFTTIVGQEVLSADGVTVKISIIAKFQVTDAVLATNSSDNYTQALYLVLQAALREIVGAQPMDEVLANRGQVDAALQERCEGKVTELGLKLLWVSVRDIMFPGDLKKVFVQVVKARQEGLAALERARGETAALRNLANAARLLENNPTLMHLRMLQTLGESSGNTVVFNLAGDGTIVPVNSGPDRDRERADAKGAQASGECVKER